MLAVVPTIFVYMGLTTIEEMKFAPVTQEISVSDKSLLGVDKKYQGKMEERSKLSSGQIGATRTTYDLYLKILAEENEWRKQVSHVIKGKEVPWEKTRQGRIKFLISHFTPDKVGLRCMEAFLQEIPPGGSSGKHRHIGEEILIVFKGKGYDIQDGARFDWEQDNLVCIPVQTTHQHFNADAKRPVKFLSVQTGFQFLTGHGDIEHFEDAWP